MNPRSCAVDLRAARVTAALAALLLALGVAKDAASVCATPGKDGPGGTLSGVVNTYFPAPSSGTTTVSAGSTSVSIGSAASGGASTAIAAGDLLLIIQMQDAAINSTDSNSYGDGAGGDPASGATSYANAGRYEFAVATGPASGGAVPIAGDGAGGGLVYTYVNAPATAAQGRRSYQVIRVPQYSSATLSSALTAKAWDGTSGGILVLDVAGQLALGGTVSMDGRGFRGGGALQTGAGSGANTVYRVPSTNGAHGSKGEGVAGTPRYVFNGTSVVDNGSANEGYPNGSFAQGAPGNAGGGGTDGNPSANDQNSGGGGGGNGGPGGRGGNTWSSNLARGGFGGSAFPFAIDRIALGGGGGAGTRNNSSGTQSSGGVGGGMIYLRAGSLTGAGTLSANGTTPPNPDNDGAGGGGAGGTVVVLVQSGTTAGLTVNARGGNGANSWPTQAPGGSPGNRHGPGGGGGGGVVLLSASGAAVNTSAGANGTTTTAADSYGTQAATSGSSSTSASSGSVPGNGFGALCKPQLTVTKVTSTPSVAQTPSGATTVYTITVSNAAGRGIATGVRISDTLPLAPQFVYNSTASVTLAGGATRPSTTNPTAGSIAPAWASFQLPGASSVQIAFSVNLAATVPAGTYQNPANVVFDDPTRSAAGQTVTPGGTYAGGGAVAGSNYDPASSTNEDVTLTAGPSVTGRVFRDDGSGGGTPNNGVLDGAEPGIATVTVQLTDCSSTTHATALTNGGGDFVLAVPAAVPNGATLCIVETNPGGHASSGGSAGTTGGTYDRTTDRVQFSYASGTSYTGLRFGDVASMTFVPDNTKTALPGSTVDFAHTFTAATGGSVTFATSATASPAVAGWSEVVYRDSNCNGILDGGEPVLLPASSVSVNAGQQVCVIVKEFVPASAPFNAQNQVTITASFTYANAVPPIAATQSRTDTTTVGQASAAALDLRKEVRNVTQGTAYGTNNSGRPTEVLEYRITYTNNSSSALANLAIHDTTPPYTLYVGASAGCPAVGARTTCTVPTEPAANGTGGIDWNITGTLAPGASSTVAYRVRIQ